MNIFNYEGEEFDKKLEKIFTKIDKDELKKELIECGLEIDESFYDINQSNNITEDEQYNTINSEQIELIEAIQINTISNFMKSEGVEEEWIIEQVLVA